ncbi:LacI family DNA-binding transcriptional regulator [Paenibacillus sp. GCM10027626]|uniref:LacI family DNA-binding transcriptional regulator n=1 Tax=Paenibacillus sp. GCM10027626 TaxID=3273411 RepID=UPI0036328CF8
MKAKKVTLQLIADHLQVSKTLVSRALLGKYGVSEEMRQKIIQKAEELGYTFPAGQGGKPAATRTNIIVTVIPRGYLGDQTYWGSLLEQIESELQRAGYSMILSPVSQSGDQELPSSIKNRQADGILLLGQIAPELVLEIQQSALPAVMVDGNPLSGAKLDHVLADNFVGMKDITTAVLESGHRRLAFIGSPAFSFSYAERWRGFRQAVDEFSLSRQTRIDTQHIADIRGDHTILEVDHALSALLQGSAPPTAIICANDAIAASLLFVLKSKNLRCPEDLTVTGFDNASASEAHRLTTIDVVKQGLAWQAVNLLVQRIAGISFNPCTLLVSGELMRRDSIFPMSQ